MATSVLIGALHPLSTTVPDFKIPLQEIPSPVREASPPAVQRALGASLTHLPGHLTCPSRPGTEQRQPLPHLTDSNRKWPSCSTAMLFNPPVSQEQPHCPELLQLQRNKLVPSLLSAYPVTEFLNPRGTEEINSPELLERVITPIMGWGTNISLPMLERDLCL